MDELIAKITANAGIEPAVARKAVAIVLGFLSRAGPPGQVQAVIDKLPGARELAAEAGGSSRDIMGVFNDLSNAGLGLGSIQQVTKELVVHARATAGNEEVDAVIEAIPGLNQFV